MAQHIIGDTKDAASLKPIYCVAGIVSIYIVCIAL